MSRPKLRLTLTLSNARGAPLVRIRRPLPKGAAWRVAACPTFMCNGPWLHHSQDTSSPHTHICSNTVMRHLSPYASTQPHAYAYSGATLLGVDYLTDLALGFYPLYSLQSDRQRHPPHSQNPSLVVCSVVFVSTVYTWKTHKPSFFQLL